jgi:hypothetical protein
MKERGRDGGKSDGDDGREGKGRYEREERWWTIKKRWDSDKKRERGSWNKLRSVLAQRLDHLGQGPKGADAHKHYSTLVEFTYSSWTGNTWPTSITSALLKVHWQELGGRDDDDDDNDDDNDDGTKE